MLRALNPQRYCTARSAPVLALALVLAMAGCARSGFFNVDAADAGPVDTAQIDATGFDVAGLDAAGLDVAGLDAASFDGAGLDAEGLDATSLDQALGDAGTGDAPTSDGAHVDAAGSDSADDDATLSDASAGADLLLTGPTCVSDSECEDGNPCTDDACSGGRCQRAVRSGSCDDGLFCNGEDFCAEGWCAPVGLDPCGGGPCDELHDSCSERCRYDFDCDDGSLCTVDSCNAGVCQHLGVQVCDDGLFCNGADSCSDGACTVHSGDPCGGGPCNERLDICGAPVLPADCETGNPCVVGSYSGVLSEQLSFSNDSMPINDLGAWTADSPAPGANDSGGGADVLLSDDLGSALTLSIELQNRATGDYEIWLAWSRTRVGGGNACDVTLELNIDGNSACQLVSSVDDSFAWESCGVEVLSGGTRTLRITCAACASRRCALDGLVLSTRGVTPATDVDYLPYASSSWDAPGLDLFDDSRTCNLAVAPVGNSCGTIGAGVCAGPLSCDDSGECTGSPVADGTPCPTSCSTVATCQGGVCVAAVSTRDQDGDGHVDDECAGGGDCDDSDPATYPGRREGPQGDATCYDGRDNDCDLFLDGVDPDCHAHPTGSHPTSAGWHDVLGGPTLNDLNAVHAFARDDVWVGGEQGELMHWDGISWTSHRITTEPINDIWGAAPDDLWVAADLVYHWQGSGWTSYPLNGHVLGVWGVDGGEVWASSQLHVQDQSIHRWDGNGWAEVTTGWAASGFWGLRRDSIWAVSDTLWRWDGSSWNPAPSPDMSPRALWGSSETDIWCVGAGRAPSYSDIQHWDGNSWSPVVSPSGSYSDVAGLAANDIWAVGSGSDFIHWDGLAWNTSTVPDSGVGSGSTRPAYLAVSAAADGSVWSAGRRGAISRWGGQRWISHSSAMLNCRFHEMEVVAADDAWIFLSCYFVDRSLGSKWRYLHFDGSSWTPHTPPRSQFITQEVRRMLSFGPDQVFALVPFAVQAWDGLRWIEINEGLDADISLVNIWGSAADDLWLAAWRHTAPFPDRYDIELWHWGGSRWVKAATPLREVGSGVNLSAMGGSGSDDAWITFQNLGSALHWDGSSWAATAAPCASNNNNGGVWGASANNVWFVGMADAACHWTGSGAVVTMPGTANEVWGLDANNVWAVGWDGLFYWNGSAWSTIATDAHRYIYPSTMVWFDVDGSSASDVWIMTEDGLILRSGS